MLGNKKNKEFIKNGEKKISRENFAQLTQPFIVYF